MSESVAPNSVRGRGMSAGKENLHNYNSVANLSAGQLKTLCQRYNIDVKFPKKARVVLLCHVLGISTTGHLKSVCGESIVHEHLSDSQRNDLKTISPAYMCRLSNWRKDLGDLPVIEESTVKRYLINTDVFSSKDARSYKISRPFALQQFVHSIFYCNTDFPDFSIIRAQCNPSQSTCQDDIKVVYVVVDKVLGEPYGAFCTCTVGKTERCGHVGAVLFKLAELQATGATEGPSCTEVRCAWAEPKGSKVPPTIFSDLPIKKTKTVIRRTVDDYGQKVKPPNPPTYNEVSELRARLIEATHHTGYYCPAIHILNASRFQTEQKELQPVNIVSDLPNKLEFDCEDLAPGLEIEVKTTPVEITKLFNQQFSSVSDKGYQDAAEALYAKAANMDIDVKEISALTKGQSSNVNWHDQRRGAITATKFYNVMQVTEKKRSANSLSKDILRSSHDKLGNVPAVKWGRRNEATDREAYEQKCRPMHKDLVVEEQGLRVYKDCTFIRGSPDGVITCSCHGPKILEIKCPYSARMLTVADGVSSGKIKYLRCVNGQYELKMDTTDGYYAQVQGLMGITNTDKCHFVVWTSKNMVVVNVPFDDHYFHNRIVPACKTFFKSEIIPKLLIKSTHGLSPSQSPSSTCATRNTRTGSVESKDEVYTATPLPTGTVTMDNQPMKRRKTTMAKPSSKTTVPTSLQLLIPAKQESKTNFSPARQILVEQSTAGYNCAACRKNLPENNIAPDNADASVGCDCPNCGGCDVWMCWPCAKYDQEWADEGYDWYCPECTRECDIVY